jgi:hypothetical protein
VGNVKRTIRVCGLFKPVQIKTLSFYLGEVHDIPAQMPVLKAIELVSRKVFLSMPGLFNFLQIYHLSVAAVIQVAKFAEVILMLQLQNL